MRDAFAGTGGQLTFVQAAAFGRDGHSLFAAGIPQWTPAVDKFFQGERLFCATDCFRCRRCPH